MNQSLAYVQEILSAHTEDSEIGKNIFDRISDRNYSSGELFARDLSEDESSYLNRILKDAIEYSNQEQDEERSAHLNEIYELLY
jgi:hypothetical protein